MKALIDGDILRYEIGFASEVGWRKIKDNPDAIPDFDYVSNMLLSRIARICHATGADTYDLYLTEGDTIRYRIATVKPYKGTRKDNKPWHFDNLTAYMKYVMNATIVTGIEADDRMAMDHIHSKEETVLCSRDKDLRQVPGLFYSWELGKQPAFGPVVVDNVGYLELSEGSPRKLSGAGYAFFLSQVLTGDVVDNIPGLPQCGPVAAYNILSPVLEDDTIDDKERMLRMLEYVQEAYYEHYGSEWIERLQEQAQLCWLIRDFNEEGEPTLWYPGLIN